MTKPSQDAETHHLERRVAELERRVAALELEQDRAMLTRPGLWQRIVTAIFG